MKNVDKKSPKKTSTPKREYNSTVPQESINHINNTIDLSDFKHVEEHACVTDPEQENMKIIEIRTPTYMKQTEDVPIDYDYKSMSVKALQELCKKRGLKVGGRKNEILQRLKNHKNE